MEDIVRVDFGQVGRKIDQIPLSAAGEETKVLIPLFRFTNKVLFVTEKRTFLLFLCLSRYKMTISRVSVSLWIWYNDERLGWARYQHKRILFFRGGWFWGLRRLFQAEKNDLLGSFSDPSNHQPEVWPRSRPQNDSKNDFLHPLIPFGWVAWITCAARWQWNPPGFIDWDHCGNLPRVGSGRRGKEWTSVYPARP